MDRNSNNNHRGTGNSRRGRRRYSRLGGRGGSSDWGGPTQFDGKHWSNRSNGQMGQGGGSYRPQLQTGGQMGQVGGSYRPQQQQTGDQMGRGVGPMKVEAVEVNGSGGFGRGEGGGGVWRSGRPGLHTQATTKPQPQPQPQPRALPEKGNECFETHLIEQDGTLNSVEFDKFLEKVNLAACGLNYAVVSVMGPQSSGKSTLLNHLFGTKFKEMDGLNERSKTTQGIWLARCAGIEPHTLVMDVEGSDGGERGEDDTAFEKRGGLFALAVSHIVLINMFQTCIGLENGASKLLWKNVLEGILRLFSPRKTTLMLVIRDLVQTPLEVLENRLRKDIQKRISVGQFRLLFWF